VRILVLLPLFYTWFCSFSVLGSVFPLFTVARTTFLVIFFLSRLFLFCLSVLFCLSLLFTLSSPQAFSCLLTYRLSRGSGSAALPALPFCAFCTCLPALFSAAPGSASFFSLSLVWVIYRYVLVSSHSNIFLCLLALAFSFFLSFCTSRTCTLFSFLLFVGSLLRIAAHNCARCVSPLCSAFGMFAAPGLHRRTTFDSLRCTFCTARHFSRLRFCHWVFFMDSMSSSSFRRLWLVLVGSRLLNILSMYYRAGLRLQNAGLHWTILVHFLYSSGWCYSSFCLPSAGGDILFGVVAPCTLFFAPSR